MHTYYVIHNINIGMAIVTKVLVTQTATDMGMVAKTIGSRDTNLSNIGSLVRV